MQGQIDIIAFRQFERLDECLTFYRNNRGKMIELGNVYANIIYSEPLFRILDIEVSYNDYLCRHKLK